MDITSIIIGLVIGSIIAYIIFYLLNKIKSVSLLQYNELTTKHNEAVSNLKAFEEKTNNLQALNTDLNSKLSTKESEYSAILTKQSSTETQLKYSETKIEELTTTLKSETETNRNQQTEINQHKQKISELNANNNSITDSLNKQNTTNDKQTKQIEELTSKLTELTSQVSSLTANNKSLTDKLDTQKTEIEKLQKTAHLQFEKIASKLLEEKSTKFTETNKTNLEALLNPLKEDIGKFKAKVEETHTEDTKQRVSLDERIKGLIDQTNKVSTEANNLATALKGKPQKRGSWGEMILERILEMSGLTKDREYFVQGSVKDEEGNNLRPDVRINLPDQRVIMIDSKVSLVAYDSFSATENLEEQKIQLAKHLEATNNHIQQLSNKNYDNLGSTLDFTMMFIPIEPAYILTIQADQSIWARAYEKRILLVSPTNLIACLKLFSDLWKRDNQSKNALKIVKQGEALYDKFVIFTKTFEEIGDSIKSSQIKYDKALGQLKDGRGNLINQGVQFKNLGLKSDKRFSENLLADSAEYKEETEATDNQE
jgi:DNA recombination protein RmuC